ncbi:MAG: acylphosphatase [Planctomycetes bacterium]|nr:acylphosphatase [Planctomycetota bacterium]
MADENGKIRAEVVISGRVQGVFFRSATVRQAGKFGVSGWVRNRRDGKVEAVFEGLRSNVRALVAWCHKGPSSARVEDVSVSWEDYRGEFSGFSVRF